MNNLIKNTVIFLSILLIACSDDGLQIERDSLPLPTPFNFYLNLDLPSYQSLEFENHLYISDYGLKGLVVVKLTNGYAVYDRVCPVNPESDCAKVDFINAGTTNSYLECQCGEAFYKAADGFPSNSPEPRKLRQYYCEYSGNTLYVDSTIL